MGLKAMEQLQELNPHKDTASDAQTMFMVINTASLTLLPLSVLMYRAQAGSAHPAAILVPLLITSLCATLSGVGMCLFMQNRKIRKNHPPLEGESEFQSRKETAEILVGGRNNDTPPGIASSDSVPLAIPALPQGEGCSYKIKLAIGGIIIIALIALLPHLRQPVFAAFLGNFLLFGFILWFLIAGAVKRLPLFDLFIEGAKEGMHTALRIAPYLVAMMAAIAVLRASGLLDLFIHGIGALAALLGLDTGFVPALPTAILKTFSGSGARALMLDTMKQYGPDSFAGMLSSLFQGSSEVVFYVLTVYFGSVGITRFRRALCISLLADLVAIVVGIIVGYWFFR